MRIIKQGKLPEEKTYQSACINCGAVFEYYKKEAKVVNDRNETVLLINCPCCNRPVTTNI